MHDPYQYQQQPGYVAPALAASSRGVNRGGSTTAISAVVLVTVFAVLGFVRYNGPVDTVRGFFNDVYVDFNVQAAANRICSDSPEKITDVAAFQQQLNQLRDT